MYVLAVAVVMLVAGFAAGIFFGRKNPKKVAKVLSAAEEAKKLM